MPRSITGVLLHRETGAPLPHLAVEILELHQGRLPSPAALAEAEVVGLGTTGPDGTFSIRLLDDAEEERDRPSGPRRRWFVAAVYVDEGEAGQERKPIFATRPRPASALGQRVRIRIPGGRLPDDLVSPASSEGEADGPPDLPPGSPQARARPPIPAELAATRTVELRNRLRSGVREALREDLTSRLESRRERRAFARGVLRRGGPRGGRANRLPPDDDPATRLGEVRQAGIERVARAPAPGIRLHLGPDEVDRIFPDGLPESRVELDPETLKELRPLIPLERGSRRLRDLLTECEAEHGAATTEEKLEAAAAEAPADAPAETTPDPAAEEVHSETRALLLRRLREVLEPPSASAGERADVGAVAEALGLDVPIGPADTTAYYDFHHLQVAWEDTWTTVLDDLTAEAVVELYDSIVQVMDWEPREPEGGEVAELQELLVEVRDAVRVATTAPGLTLTSELLSWLPEIGPVWETLPPETQEWMRFLHWVDSLDLWTGVWDYMGAVSVDALDPEAVWPDEWTLGLRVSEVSTPDWGRVQAEDFLDGWDPETAASSSGLARLERLVGDLEARLLDPYRFDVFVADPPSYNYGILTTYRQEWAPLTYQVGDLVASMPLAPGETRSFSTKRSVKTSRARKEVEKAMATREGEYTTTGRAESEIVQRASNATNFSMSGQGSVNVQLEMVSAGGSFGAEAGASQSAESAKTKRDFREAVQRAAQEYRDERVLEVSTKESFTEETTERREISNPNNELTVTYLLYELQRRFRVTERLHKLTPVVLVAFEVPAPHEITEGWLLAHEWILRRVLLDDTLLPALDMLRNGFAGGELGVEILRAQWEAQIEVVAAIRDNAAVHRRLRDAARNALEEVTETVAYRDGLIKNLGEALFPSGPEEAEVQAAQREAAQQALEWANQDMAASRAQMDGAVTALRQATDDYVEALKARLDRRVALDQLRVHVKENILYYMQAIWSHEPPDQRYFRLYDLEVQWPEAGGGWWIGRPTGPTGWGGLGAANRLPDSLRPGPLGGLEVELIPPKPKLGASRPLHQVADLDSLLGFKGNYGIFPLKEDNPLTDYMAQAYLDSWFGLLDPDPLGRVPTTEEALELVECAWRKPGVTDEEKAELTAWLMDVMALQKRISEEVVVPTGQLFMEALPGAHPLLEDFKLQHRAVDLKRALNDLGLQEMEALRRAARLLDGDLSDVDVDQRIEISGPGTVDVELPPSS
jgi:hypothetical protein